MLKTTTESASSSESVSSSKPEKTANETPISVFTILLSTAVYTRGLWSLFNLWRKSNPPPFRFNHTEWGIQLDFFQREFRRAFGQAIVWTLIEIVVLGLWLSRGSTISGLTFVWLVLTQWIVFPYFAAKAVLRRAAASFSTPPPAGVVSLVLDEAEASIPDLGYLLREACFCVDSNKKTPGWDVASENPDASPLSADSIYRDIEGAFADPSSGITCRKVRILASHDMPPLCWESVPEALAASLRLNSKVSERLLVFGQPTTCDALASVELTARTIDSHAAFRLRVRWLPGLKDRYQGLLLVVKQKVWWRGIAVPLALAVMILAAALLAGAFIDSLNSSTASLSGMRLLNSHLEVEVPPFTDIPLEVTPIWIFQKLLTGGTVSVFANLCAVVAFLPILLFVLSMILRCLRAVRGFLYAATGTVFHMGCEPSLRFNLSSSGLGKEGPLQVSIPYLQVIEEVLTNRIIGHLHRKGIDTSTIRDEMKLFINEGIYMTGGALRASNLLVGQRGALNFGGRRKAKSGQRSLLRRNENSTK